MSALALAVESPPSADTRSCASCASIADLAAIFEPRVNVCVLRRPGVGGFVKDAIVAPARAMSSC